MISLGCSLTGQRRRSAPASPSDPAFTIATITNDGGKCKITTVGNHELGGFGGQYTLVEGNSVAGYNTSHQIVDASDPAFIITDQPYTSNGTGGTISPPFNPD